MYYDKKCNVRMVEKNIKYMFYDKKCNVRMVAQNIKYMFYDKNLMFVSHEYLIMISDNNTNQMMDSLMNILIWEITTEWLPKQIGTNGVMHR